MAITIDDLLCRGAMRLEGRTARLAFVSEFVEDAKASGLVQRAIDGASVRGVQVAAPGNANAQ